MSRNSVIIPEFQLECGQVLHSVPVVYNTYGTLNSSKDNVIIVCHALSGSSEIREWWNELLGSSSSKAFNTNEYFIFCGNVLASPYGTCSPITQNPHEKTKYGPEFPLNTIRDDVLLHKQVLDMLGITRVKFCIGASMGGMHALEWSVMYGKEYIENVIAVATCGRYSGWCIAWNEIQRQCIYSDSLYNNGYYEHDNPPVSGLSTARMNALMTYRSRDSFHERFSRNIVQNHISNFVSTTDVMKVIHNEGNQIRMHYQKPVQFTDESTLRKKEMLYDTHNQLEKNNSHVFDIYSAQVYLRYQGDKFVSRFDANCYISITRKLDTHDLGRGRGNYKSVLANITQPCFIIGVRSDGLFPICEQEELARNIPNAEFYILESDDGHDGFLIESDEINRQMCKFINKHSRKPQ